ncbi:YaiI/YqxD family protein [Desulfotalea psychrophila]|uniref:UPF0178 protein DP1304 n=1 Tax=Desulfotalea psychrophila (strain LSv54 / DSM 12343) TaxID=177439 RepID=Y1304_DESPS|nr:YaiI/YqxD family protein [Desulfotalea psychrophila]Q6ANP1.1 RecName: Full=UPF0178 protein DP1304 [Desulfotalea psychrophila LSv54]CAG36033.1 conserved hypothetical protein [Desulfotalea psychrophila LSv54]
MKIWVDADAAPVAIKEILYKLADKRKVETIFVANRVLKLPRSQHLHFRLVAAGADVADGEIVRLLKKGDLVITADIPLASLVVEKGGTALNPRGELYTKENIAERLSSRDFMQELRDGGVETGGAPPFSAKDKQRFANAIDRILARLR